MRPLTLVAVPLLIASLAGNAFYWWAGRHIPTCESPVTDGPVAVHVKGGLLEVSTIKSPERFTATADDTILGVPIGKVFTKIEVPVVYRYHVKLAEDWKVMLKDKTFIVISPPVAPSLPVAFDSAQLKGEANGQWVTFTGSGHIRQLERSITKTLAEKAASPSYINFQREEARSAVREFLAKWLVTQEQWKSTAKYPIRVFFADEPIQSMSTVPQPFAGVL